MASLHGEPTRDGSASHVSARLGAVLARALAERGVFDEGDAHGHEGIRIAEALDHPFSLVWDGLSGLAYLKRAGGAEQAVPLLERAVAKCRE